MRQRTAVASHHGLCLADRLQLWIIWALLVAAYACLTYGTALAAVDWRAFVLELGLFAVVFYGAKRLLALAIPYCRKS